MKRNITLLDGALGTSLWKKSGDSDPVWRYNIEKPDLVVQLHREYIDAGAEIITANTFSAHRSAVSASPYTVEQVVSAGVRLAKEAAAGRAKVALDVGPLSELVEPYGDLSEEEAAELFEEHIAAGMSEGADLIFFETFFDLEMMKIAVGVAKKYDVPIFCSMSFEQHGHTMMGNTAAQIAQELSELGVSAVGLNCSVGPDAALAIVEQFRQATGLSIICKPNAGTAIGSNGEMKYYDRETFVNALMPAPELGAAYIGGCCGTDPAYIALLRDRLKAQISE